MNQNKDIKKGMQLAADKPDLMPDEISERLRPVYEDIQQSLRVPLVNQIFRTLANYPDYLESMWLELSPYFSTEAFEKQADDIRKIAVPDEIPDVSELDLEKFRKIEQLKNFNDTIYYVLPKLLLITSLFYELSYGKKQISSKKLDENEHSAKIPSGILEGMTKVQMLDSEKASMKVSQLFDSIKDIHQFPLIPSYYRGVANWPDFLEKTWNRINPIVGSTAYEKRKQELVEQAELALKHLPLQIKHKHPINDKKENEEIRLILLAFKQKFIPEMLLDLALIETILYGKEWATFSRFSATNNS